MDLSRIGGLVRREDGGISKFSERTIVVFLWASFGLAGSAYGQAVSVIGTKHNLSVFGPGEITAVTETEVCKFCHIPHSSVSPIPMWGRPMPGESVRYEVPDLLQENDVAVPAPQPDGSSRLCLSCHDGTIALGELTGRSTPIRMKGADRLSAGRPGFLGTDLSGSHPISIVVGEVAARPPSPNRDMGLKPSEVIVTNLDIRLDESGKMQCSTCHTVHSDANFKEGSVPHFWAKPTVEEVCT
jgi:hypothetical protein